MTGKEALENIKTAPSFMGGNPRYWTCLESRIPFLEDIETIQQDLDKLEELEKKNAILKNQILSLELDTCIPELREENEKLKQALDILLRKLDIRLTKTENYDTAETYYSVYNKNSCEVLYPEEYELLKEVL